MGNLAAGLIMVFFVIVLTTVLAFIEQGTTPGTDSFGCDSEGNATVCEGGSPQSFIDSFFDVAVSGLDGADPVFNGFYLLGVVGILVIGFTLIVAGILGVPFGGG